MKPSEYLLRAHEAGVEKIEGVLEQDGAYCGIGVIGRCTNTPVRLQPYIAGRPGATRNLHAVVSEMADRDPHLLALHWALQPKEREFANEVLAGTGTFLEKDALVMDLIVVLNDTPIVAGPTWEESVYLNFREMGHILRAMGF